MAIVTKHLNLLMSGISEEILYLKQMVHVHARFPDYVLCCNP
jgi:hypothetical protein